MDLVYAVPNQDPSALVSDTTNWVWDTNNSNNGYRRVLAVSNNWLGSDRDVPLLIPPELSLADIDVIKANFTGYFNTPASALHHSILVISLDDASTVLLGTIDSHSPSTNGQTIYQGDAGILNQVQQNVINEEFVYTVPAGKRVTAISLRSYYLSGFPDGRRGIRDIRFYSVTYGLVSGVVRLNGSPIITPVRIVDAASGGLLDTVTSDSSGFYEWFTTSTNPVYAYPVAPAGHQPIIHGPITPAELPEN